MKLILCVLLFVLSADQVSKYAILKHFAVGESLAVFDNVFHLTLVLNRGVAFGLFNNNALFTKLLVFVGCVVVIYLFRTMRALSTSNRIAAGMMIGGALGNIIDRVRYGAVVDFLDFRIWPVFNIADSFICISAFMFIIIIFSTQSRENF
jgi:signal peptidase II